MRVSDSGTVRVEVTARRSRSPGSEAVPAPSGGGATDSLALVSSIVDGIGSSQRRSGECTTWADLRY
ncbi:hypothetical protein LP52_11270 [Streptomonospora alba]|uniref:Uncharacterized protein n=1 Tax=Streptomonospora alba TaxID=183763 RepID=A0A0C2FHH1_9ACTN|nr:hypothetical protein LP52_11270 [Streptomonospora alba]